MSRQGALAFVLASLVSIPAWAQTCVGSLYSENYASTISIVTSDPNITSSNIDGAIGKWQTCWQMGSGFPALVDSGAADLSFSVILVPGNSTTATGGCAEFRPSLDQYGRIIGGVIAVWDAQANGRDCEPIRAVSIAHEIGHGLGLDDSACSGYIMGPPSGTPNDVPNAAECDKVNDRWTTNDEFMSSCYDECRGTCDSQGNCTDQEPSPIIIDLSGHGYHLTSAANGVRFDLDADGYMEDVAWTSGDAANAFLCLDINGNGAIDSGSELFGNYSVLPDGSRATNGFAALAAYDSQRFGGNANGWVDSDDAIWPQLRLWVDINHDGVSQSNELMTLDAAGIVRINTRYNTERRRDQFGNLFRYRGTFVMIDTARHEVYRNVYDVFLKARQ